MQPSKISWCSHTSNPIKARQRETGQLGWACTKISPACAHCYAEALNLRLGTREPFTPAGNINVEWMLVEKELQALARAQAGMRVFLCSMTDLFHPSVPDAWRDEIFAVVWDRSRATFQTLTKYPETQYVYWTAPERAAQVAHAASEQLGRRMSVRRERPIPIPIRLGVTLPLRNLWMGTTVENRRFLKRIDWLRQTPAAVRFLSLEPLLEDLGRLDLSGIHQAIIGAESGTSRRPWQLTWVESLIKQCDEAEVAPWLKQGSALRPGRQADLPAHVYARQEWPVCPSA